MTPGVHRTLRVRHAGRVVVLVPRQLRITGMTGNVPYYGGRLTPAQAFAASHPAPSPAQPLSAPPPDGVPPGRSDPLEALGHLLETGVLDEQEYERLRARITP